VTLGNLPYAVAFLIFLVGIYCALSSRNLMKAVFGFSISSYGINILFTQIGYVSGAGAPIYAAGREVVDPLVQAFVLTAIVVEFGLMMYILSLGVRMYEERGDMDISLLRRLKG